VEYQTLEKSYSFFARLCGIKEATKGAIVGGRIDRINASTGDYVKKNQIIVEFAEDNPGLQYEQARNAFENAEKTFNRMKTLLQAGETSQANYDGAETQYLVAKRNYESLHQMLFIQSPFDGVIVNIKVNEGDNVDNDTHLFTVAQLYKVRAKVWASETEIKDIKKGMKAELDFAGEKYPGKVVEISLAADPYKQAFYAEVEFDNPGNHIKTGVVSDIKIFIYRNDKSILIPRNVVKNDSKGFYVFVEKDNKAEKKYITNCNDVGLNYEVSNGLDPGDKLVTEGTSQLEEGVKVKVIQ
jgi:RND family efflux transporter MFP subunit